MYYQTDLAYVHDKGYADIAIHAAQALLHQLKVRHLPAAPVVDLGCGSGNMAALLTQAGCSVIGVDFSADILQLAKENAPDAEFVQASIWDYAIPPAIAITAIGEILTYQFDTQNTEENRLRLFRHIHAQLVVGGIFLFDLLEQGILQGKNSDLKVVEEPEWTMAIRYSESTTTRELTRDITLFRKLPDGLYRQSKETHRVRLFDVATISGQLSEVGFEVQTLDEYHGLKFRPGHVGFLAVKKAP
ncbi:MAG TPA: class I SAM-dependent methyltransferase [Saprospiraceae bacterium]|nr:class I SAM-dependent methyltransferase [Saprospiraceae bacterium]HMQ85596.1 class I SAM-dependent methyltransferase [Saprospiraceae bacterium]